MAAGSEVMDPPAPAGFVDEPPVPAGFQDEPPAPSGFVDEPKAPADVPNPAVVQRQAALPARTFTVAEKVQGAVQAGLNLATAVVGGTVGMFGGVAASALGLANQGAQKVTGQPVSDQPNALQASSEIGQAVTRGLHSMFGSDMTGNDEDSAAGEKYTHDYVEPILEGMQALTGHLGEFAVAHGTAPSADAVRGAITESGVRPAVRAAAADAVNAGANPMVQAAGRAAAERPPAAVEPTTAAKLEAPTLQGIRNARDAGYVLTATEGGAGEMLKGVEGVAGEPKLAKGAALKNQPVTNKLVRQDVGLPEDQPITRKALSDIRDEEGKHYDAIKQTGDINNDREYLDDVNGVVKMYDDAGESFPNSTDRPFQKTLDDMRAAQTMSAPSAIAQVKLLRQKSDTAYRQGDSGLGAVYKGFAKALDDSIDRHLTRLGDLSGNPELAQAVDNYRAARTRIAKTYLADAALNPTTGNVNALTYAAAHKRSPNLLTGPGRQIAEFATQFPRLARGVEKLGNTGSPTFADLALMAVTGGKEALLLGARPAARAALLSDVGQKFITRRARNAAPVDNTPPPFDPSTSPGAGPEASQPQVPFNPLGDTTPDWQTAPGAGGGGAPPGIEPTGLVRSVDEPPHATEPGLGLVPPDQQGAPGPGQQIPGVNLVPEPALEGALPPEYPTARGAPESPGSQVPAVPGSEKFIADVTRNPRAPNKIPTGKAREPLSPEEESAWRKQFSLGNEDAARAKDVADALAIDPHATELAAQLYDKNPAKFDAEIAKIKARGETHANEGNQAAAGSESSGARPGDDGAASLPTGVADQARGEPVQGSEPAGGGGADSAGRASTTGPSEPTTTAGVNDGNVRRETDTGNNPEGQAESGARGQGGQTPEEGSPQAEDSLRVGAADPGAKVLGTPEATRAALVDKMGEKLIKGLEDAGVLKFATRAEHGNIPARGAMRERGQPAATLYVDTLTKESAPQVLMHELGAHFGIVRLLGEERYRLLLKDLRGLRSKDPDVKAAWTDITRRYTGEKSATKYTVGDRNFMHEVAAHLVEKHPDLPIVRRLVNEVRAYFYERFGTSMGNTVDANLVRGLAASALRKAASGKLDRMSTPVRFAPPKVSTASPRMPPEARRKAVNQAMEIDARAVDNAAQKFDGNPMGFDREIQRIIASRKP